jgi:hypothetical protein
MNTMKNNKLIFSAIFVLLIAFSSCEKQYDAPPEKKIPVGKLLTLKKLQQMYVDSVINDTNGRTFYKFTEDYSLYATVSMDEKSGNIYKTIYLQDDSAAMAIKLLNPGGVYQGDYIRLYLKGTRLILNRSGLEVDSVNVDNNIIKQTSGNTVEPIKLKIGQINNSHINYLIQVDSCEFEGNIAGSTYANKDKGWFKEYNLVDCYEKTLLVHTSDYAGFASDIIPEGSGSVIGILAVYDNKYQFIIRNPDENNMTGTRCTKKSLLFKDFEDNSLTSGGWRAENVLGAQVWSVGTIGGKYAMMSGYSGGNFANEDWLISPSINASSYENVYFEFRNAYRYTGDVMRVYVSNDYPGSGNPNDYTWTELNYTKSSGNFVWVKSGVINLNTYKASPFRVAFKYTSTTSSGSTWEVDDIVISVD